MIKSGWRVTVRGEGSGSYSFHVYLVEEYSRNSEGFRLEIPTEISYFALCDSIYEFEPGIGSYRAEKRNFDIALCGLAITLSLCEILHFRTRKHMLSDRNTRTES